jgi:tetratricopeptide (TPR) repeat protein
MARPSRFHLLFEPRETLPVLEYVAAHAETRPRRAAKELGVGINTWYDAVKRLDRLGLIAITRQPGGTRTRRILLTSKGETLLGTLNETWALVKDTPAALEFELQHSSPSKGSDRAGEVLCFLIQDAERRGDFEDLQALEQKAKELGRRTERWMAVQVRAFLHGNMKEAKAAGDRAIAGLGHDDNSPSRRKILSVYAATLEYLGDEKGAYDTHTKVRILARKAHDFGLESDAWLGIGILKTRSGQIEDGIKFLVRALEAAEKSGHEGRRAKVLANLCFAEMVAGKSTALACADKALKAARHSGARIIVGRAQLNRALMLAEKGRKDEALSALREARRILEKGGEERGPRALEEWAALVRRILRPRHAPYPEDWRDQALLLARKRP